MSFALRVSEPMGPKTANTESRIAFRFFKSSSVADGRGKRAAHRTHEHKSIRRFQTKLERAIPAHRKARDRAAITRFDRAITLLHVRNQFLEDDNFRICPMPRRRCRYTNRCFLRASRRSFDTAPHNPRRSCASPSRCSGRRNRATDTALDTASRSTRDSPAAGSRCKEAWRS